MKMIGTREYGFQFLKWESVSGHCYIEICGGIVSGVGTVKQDCLRLVEWSSLQTVDLSVSLTLDHQSLNL